MDLISLGAKWDKNSNRPYFEGHERSDVVDARKEFVAYFLIKRHLYYSTVRDVLFSKSQIQQERDEFCWLMTSRIIDRVKYPKAVGCFLEVRPFSINDAAEA